MKICVHGYPKGSCPQVCESRVAAAGTAGGSTSDSSRGEEEGPPALKELLGEVRKWIDENQSSPEGSRQKVGEILNAVSRLQPYRELAIDAVTQLLVLLNWAESEPSPVTPAGRNDYDGEDLREMSTLVSTLTEIGTPAEILLPEAFRLMGRTLFTQYFAEPNPSGDPDKFERDRDVESSQDRLCQACLGAVARYPRTAMSFQARPILEPFLKHRAPWVVRRVQELLQDA